MSCCDNYNAVCLAVSPCDTGIDTTLKSDFTGDLTAIIEFNGTVQEIALSVTLNEEIILPNVLNNNYNHQVKFVKSDGSLMYDTCYTIKIKPRIFGSDNIVPTPPLKRRTETFDFEFTVLDNPDTSVKYTLWNGTQIQAQYPTGNPVIIPYFVGLDVHLPLFINNDVTQNATYDKTTGAISYPFYNGDIISGQFEQPI